MASKLNPALMDRFAKAPAHIKGDASKFGGSVHKLMGIASRQTRLWHLQTDSYAQHMALGAFYEGIECFDDNLIESFQGYYNTRISGDMSFSIDSTYTKGKPAQWMKIFKKELMKIYENRLMDAPCLKAIMDEILGLVDKTIYLLSLKG